MRGVLACVLLIAGCGASHAPEAPDDAGRADGEAAVGFDAGPRDAGRPEAGGDDAGRDAGPPDAGPPACETPHDDCNGLWEDGCETDLRTDRESCGACGRSCPDGEACAGGLCDSERVVQLAVAYDHACLIRTSGALDCWGDNTYGQLGDGTTMDRSAPVRAMDRAVDVGVSGVHTCALDAERQPWCWGTRGNGALGTEATEDATRPVRTEAVGPYDDLVVGGPGTCHAACALAGGSMTCWGSPYCGTAPDEWPLWQPRAVPSPAGVVEMVIGNGHNCALLDDASVWCWGHDDYGQLGRGTFSSGLRDPAPVTGLGDVQALGTTQGMHTCAIRRGGRLVCWGWNDRGQLGDGTTDDRSSPVPVRVPEGSSFVGVATGLSATCAIDDTSQVWCWGGNVAGELGDGTFDDRPEPRPVAGMDDVVWVGFGGLAVCALHRTGAVSCWGDVPGDPAPPRPSPRTVIGLR